MKSKKEKKISYKNLQFTAIIKPAEEGGYYAYCPLLPGCASQGETYSETVKNIEDAIKGCIEVMIEHNDPLPREALDANYTVDIPIAIPDRRLSFT